MATGSPSELPLRPGPTSAGGAPPAGGPAPSIVPAGAPPVVAPASTKAKDIAPPRVASEGDQLKALDIVDAAIVRSAGDDPEAQKAAFRLRALYRLMVTGTGVGESWGTRLSPVAAARLVLFCGANALDPSSNDVYILGDRPYLSFEGRLKIAHRSGSFEGFEVDRPMTKEERETYGSPEDAVIAWISTARRKDCRFPFLGIGYARRQESNPVAKAYPLDMAQKRARANALGLAYPADISLPPLEVERIESSPAAPPPAPSLPAGASPAAPPDDLPPTAAGPGSTVPSAGSSADGSTPSTASAPTS